MAKTNEELQTTLAQSQTKSVGLSFEERAKGWYGANAKRLTNLMGTQKEATKLFLCAINAVGASPKLVECTFDSFAQCILTSAELKLYCGVSQECAYVPFFNGQRKVTEAKFMPMYRGLLKLAHQHPDVSGINAGVVYDEDTFEFEFGTSNFLRHKPTYSHNRGDIVAAYAIATVKGEKVFCVLSRDEIDSIKNRSKAASSQYGDSPWKHEDNYDFDEMCKKTALKRLCKIIPYSLELASAIDYDNKIERPDLHKQKAIEFPALVQAIEQKDPPIPAEINVEKVVQEVIVKS